MAEPDADFDALLAEMGTLQEEIDAADAWDLDSQLEQAMAALQCPPGTSWSRTCPAVRSAASRSASSCCRSPTCSSSTSPPTTSTPSPCSGSSSTCSSTTVPSLAVTHDRYFLDHVAQWIAEVDRTPVPVRGQLLDLPREEARSSRGPGQEGRQAREASVLGARLGPQQPEGPPGEVQGPPRPLRGDGVRGRAHAEARLGGDRHPRGPASGFAGDRTRESCTSSSVSASSSTTCRSRCPATASSASSARTASARPRCSRRSSVSSRSTPAR